MKRTYWAANGLSVAALATVGCGEASKTPGTGAGRAAVPPKAEGQKEGDHDHGKGPNGGVVFDLGKHHAEFTVDHSAKECAILILGFDEKTPRPVAAKELTLTTKETKTKEGKVVPPMTIKLVPSDEKDGKATKFVGTDPGLGNVADFAGTIVGAIDGKPSQGEFKE